MQAFETRYSGGDVFECRDLGASRPAWQATEIGHVVRVGERDVRLYLAEGRTVTDGLVCAIERAVRYS